MIKVGVEGIAILLGVSVVLLAIRYPIATDDDVNFFIVLISSGAVWEGARFSLKRWFLKAE